MNGWHPLRLLMARGGFLLTQLVRVWTLPRQTRMLLYLCATLQIIARAALNLVSVSHTVSAATWVGGRLKCRRIDAETLRWAIAATAARTGGSCLTQALAARVIGSANGNAPLVISVRRQMNPSSSADPTASPTEAPPLASAPHHLAIDTVTIVSRLRSSFAFGRRASHPAALLVGQVLLRLAWRLGALGATTNFGDATLGTKPPSRSTRQEEAFSHRNPEFHAWTEIDGVCVPCTPDAASFVRLMVWR